MRLYKTDAGKRFIISNGPARQADCLAIIDRASAEQAKAMAAADELVDVAIRAVNLMKSYVQYDEEGEEESAEAELLRLALAALRKAGVKA